MFSIGCIQAQVCNTGYCPTGVTTQDPVRQKALVVPNKAERVFNFHNESLKSLKELVEAAGLHHPHEITAAHIVRRVSQHEIRLLAVLFPEMPQGMLLQGNSAQLPKELPRVFEFYWDKAQVNSFKAAEG
jgi:hypothetical protein